MIERYDVVVVGAGPAGCMAAHYLPADFKVLLIDRDTLPRHKPCGGMLHPNAWEFVRGFGMPEDLLLEPRGLSFRFVDLMRGVKRDTGLILHNASRDGFDAWLLSLLGENVEVADRTRLTSMTRAERGVLLWLASDRGEKRVWARAVVGADGARSRVRHLLGRNPTRLARHYVILQDLIEPDDELPPYFDCIALTEPGGDLAYAYVAPKGRFALIGSVFYPGSTGIAARHRRILDVLKRHGMGGRLVRREGGLAIRVRSPADVVLGDGSVLLVGEAAGLISPTSGEGISYALQSGSLCAQAIATSSDPLQTYRRLASPLVAEVSAKLRRLPLGETRLGRRLLAIMPPILLAKVTRRL